MKHAYLKSWAIELHIMRTLFWLTVKYISWYFKSLCVLLWTVAPFDPFFLLFVVQFLKLWWIVIGCWDLKLCQWVLSYVLRKNCLSLDIFSLLFSCEDVASCNILLLLYCCLDLTVSLNS
jgi:hypothetical protein